MSRVDFVGFLLGLLDCRCDLCFGIVVGLFKSVVSVCLCVGWFV